MKVKVALLADSAIQFLSREIKKTAAAAGLELDLYEGPFGQIQPELLDPTSRASDADFVLILQSSEGLFRRYCSCPPAQRAGFAAEVADGLIKGASALLERKADARVIVSNFPELPDGIFGHYANKTEESFLYQVRQLNLNLTHWSRGESNGFILDFAALHTCYGSSYMTRPALWISSGIVISPDATPLVAGEVVKIISGQLGRANKCLICDLDNTLWGGVIGDDGLENIKIGNLGIGRAFSELQLWVRELGRRGILLVVCSKNEEALAKEPFDRHPDMILRLSDFAAFVANWHPKPENIRRIQPLLDIGYDSMVFLDDEPAERLAVKMEFPMIQVPDLPKDPADRLSFLRAVNLFEASSFTPGDRERHRHYQAESQRESVRTSAASYAEYLEKLNLRIEVGPLDALMVPRVFQLSQRSNQFNLRTVRYSEAAVRAMLDDASRSVLVARMQDRFEDYGIISVAFLARQSEALFVENWITSCRAFGRGLEKVMFEAMIAAANRDQAKRIVGEYIPTAKNLVGKDVFSKLGFQHADNLWIYELHSVPNEYRAA
jgi:FkbH-like protein